MDASTDTRERIIEAAAELLRRFGPEKTNVVDVARALHMSHANVYRHFANKAELMDTVAERWLHRISEPLTEIAAGKGDAESRLRQWLQTLIAMKRAKVLDDPELFETYHRLALSSRRVVDDHVREIQGQVTQMIADGVAEGRFTVADPAEAGEAIFLATTRFHHPYFIHQDRGDSPDPGPILDLLFAGLKA